MIEEKINGSKYYKKLMVYDNTTQLKFIFQNIIFLLDQNENHYRYLEPNLNKFNIKNNDIINNNSMNITPNSNNINNKIYNISNYTLNNKEDSEINLQNNKKVCIKDTFLVNNILMNDIKEKKNIILNKDIKK